MSDRATDLLSDLAKDLFVAAASRRCELGPGQPNSSARSQLEKLSPETLLKAGAIHNRSMAEACCAALWLAHDFLDESHRISQEIETPEGSYWHGIMHRREPDADNAKYWFNRVGRHPVFQPLRQAAVELAHASPAPRSDFLLNQSAWDVHRWIDICEAARKGQTPTAVRDLCERIQAAEWRLLFDYCLRGAAAG